jgi:P-type conjugative transfer protein TrbG
MSWKWIDRMVYSMLGLSSAAVVSALVAVALLIAGPPPMWAQSAAPTAPVVLKRVSTPDSQAPPTPTGSGPDPKPAASQPATPANPNSSAQLPASSDYAKALTILKRDPLTTPAKPLPSINAAQPASETTVQPAAASAVPKDFVEHKNILLSQSAQAGVDLSESLQSEKNMPAPTKDGRILYTYGVGLPTAVCAPFRVCTIELQPGEKLTGEPRIGDDVRWLVEPGTSGTGDAATPLLLIKPRQDGLDTNMVVTTDRRTYYVRLISKTTDYIARMAFNYPDDEKIKWDAYLQKQKQEEAQDRAASRVDGIAPGGMDSLFFDYQVKGSDHDPSIRPIRVLDDGVKTYIVMSALTEHRELPTLVIDGVDGNEMVNYRVKGDTYIVDRLFDRAALLLGVGKHQEKVEITRQKPISGAVAVRVGQ